MSRGAAGIVFREGEPAPLRRHETKRGVAMIEGAARAATPSGLMVTLRRPNAAAMTRAPAGHFEARSIPAMGDRLMVGLQTLTLPV